MTGTGMQLKGYGRGNGMPPGMTNLGLGECWSLGKGAGSGVGGVGLGGGSGFSGNAANGWGGIAVGELGKGPTQPSVGEGLPLAFRKRRANKDPDQGTSVLRSADFATGKGSSERCGGSMAGPSDPFRPWQSQVIASGPGWIVFAVEEAPHEPLAILSC